MKIILVIFYRILVKTIELGNTTIKSVGDFSIKFSYSKIIFFILIFGDASLKFVDEPINLVMNKI
jgi:hypothetical protein